MDFEDKIPTTDSLGRSFMATHGLTSKDVDLLAIESIVGPGPRLRRDLERVTFERRQIAEVTVDRPRSIAEVAVACSLPLLASQLLVSTMVSEELLHVNAAASTAEIDLRSLQLIRQKIEGLR